MAYLNIFGEETQDASEYVTTSGTFSVQTTTKRTGNAALQINVSGAAGYVEVRGLAANGTGEEIARTAATYYARYIRFGTLPSANQVIMSVVKSDGTVVLDVKLDNLGVLTLVGSTTSSTIATLSINTWYLLEIKCVSNATSEARIDGGTAQTATANNVTQDRLRIGSSASNTYNFYSDDGAINDSEYPGAGQVVNMVPDGNGSATTWTGSATDVDETPHNSDTDYITTSASGAHQFSLPTAAAAGVIGSIGTVKSWLVGRSSDTFGALTVGLDSNGSFDQSSLNSGIAIPYIFMADMAEVDPDTSATWTTGGLDGVETRTFASTSEFKRVTATGIMVWSTGTLPTRRYTLTTVGVG